MGVVDLILIIAVVAFILTMKDLIFNGDKKKKKYEVDYPIAYHTVDVAIIKKVGHEYEVLLIQKPHEVALGIWRFPGGFIDPTDMSAESAALREVGEETKMQVDAKNVHYITSTRIDDERYRNSPHKIITSFYATIWVSGEDGVGFDDVKVTKFFKIKDVVDGKIKQNPIHDALFYALTSFVREGGLI